MHKKSSFLKKINIFFEKVEKSEDFPVKNVTEKIKIIKKIVFLSFFLFSFCN